MLVLKLSPGTMRTADGGLKQTAWCSTDICEAATNAAVGALPHTERVWTRTANSCSKRIHLREGGDLVRAACREAASFLARALHIRCMNIPLLIPLCEKVNIDWCSGQGCMRQLCWLLVQHVHSGGRTSRRAETSSHQRMRLT